MLAIAVSQLTYVLAERTPSSERRPQQAGSYRGMCKHRKLVRQPQCGSVHTSEEPGRLAGRLVFAFAVHAPSRGRAEVLRSGQPGMDAGLAAPGHGWPMAAGPRSRTGARAWRALASHRTKGARALGYLALLQVTRRKGETISGRYRKNGYAPKPSRQQKRRPKAPFALQQINNRQAISAVVSNSKVSSPSFRSICTTPPWSASSPKRISSASGRLILS